MSSESALDRERSSIAPKASGGQRQPHLLSGADPGILRKMRGGGVSSYETCGANMVELPTWSGVLLWATDANVKGREFRPSGSNSPLLTAMSSKPTMAAGRASQPSSIPGLP